MCIIPPSSCWRPPNSGATEKLQINTVGPGPTNTASEKKEAKATNICASGHSINHFGTATSSVGDGVHWEAAV